MRAILIALLMVSLAGAEDWAPDQHIDDVFPISFNLHDAFGAASDADSAPAYRWYEDGTNMSALNSTLSLNDSSNTDGYYRGTTTLSAANGFEPNKNYEVRVSAVVDGVTGAQVTKFRIVDSLATTIQAANDSRFDDVDTQLDSIEGTLDLTNAQVEAITSVSQLTASGATIGVGTQASGTYASTAVVDGTTHDILADSEGVTPLSVTYSFTVPTGGIGTKVTATTESTSVQLRTVSAYNYLTSAWDTIGTASHTTMTERQYALGQEYTSDAGAMQIRFTAGSTYADQTLGVDGLIVNYRQNLNDAIAELVTANSVTADRVPKQLTFFVGSEGNASRNIVTLNAWSSGTRTLAYDLTELLAQSETNINSVSSVTVVKGATSITTSNLRKHQNGKVAMWDNAAISSANSGTYVVTVTVTTADSNTIVLTGTLEVE